MIDDIVEGLGKAIFKGIFRFIFDLLIEAFFFYTGEIVLFILTLGKKKPRWDYYIDESPSKWVILQKSAPGLELPSGSWLRGLSISQFGLQNESQE